MKNLLTYVFFAGLTTGIYAQDAIQKVAVCEAVYEDFQAYPNLANLESQSLSHTANINSNQVGESITLTGIVYQADGVTPASDVLVYIEQANADGEYEIHNHEGKNEVIHSAVVKTNQDGLYSFNTFIPGHTKEKLAYRRTQRAQHIHIMIKEPNKPAYELPAFVFDSDWMVNKAYKKRLQKRGYDIVLSLTEENGKEVARKDIVLSDVQASK